MRDHRPPERIAPAKFAGLQSSFSGVLPVAYFERLSGLLASAEGDVLCALDGVMDEAGHPLLKARVQTTLTLQCQTCFAPLQFSVDHSFTFCVVKDEEEAEYITEYEPLVCDGDEMFVKDIFEDELILSLPVVANHAPEECAVGSDVLRQHDESEAGTKPNPFAVLAGLKKPGK